MKKIISIAAALLMSVNVHAAPMKHTSYISGYPGKIFSPDGSVSRAEISKIIVESLDIRLESGSSFSDIGLDHWAGSYIYTAKNKEYIKGYENNAFIPDKKITRAEFCAIVYRTIENYVPDDLKKNEDYSFSDSSKHWAKREINVLEKLGAVKGNGSGQFNPEGLITRAEAVTVINRVQGRIPDKTRINEIQKQVYKDKILAKHWAYYDIIEASVDHQFFIEQDSNKNQTEFWTRLYF